MATPATEPRTDPLERDETPAERLDRNTGELLQEMRVVSLGIQVVFAFLLVVPFNNGWRRVTTFDRYDYYVTLVCIAVAAALLIAPSIHHRLLFRQGQKQFLVDLGNSFLILAMAFLTVGLTGIFVLISHVVFGAAAAVVAGVLTAVGLSTLWFAVPLIRRRKLERFQDEARG